MAAPPLDELLAYLEFGDGECELLAGLEPLLEKQADTLVAAFYRHLLSFPHTRQLLRDPDVKNRLMGMQRTYLISLAAPRPGAGYAEERRRIGEVHERIGLDPSWYLGAYALYLSLLTPLVFEHAGGDLETGERTLVALQKRILFDASIAMEAYVQRRESDLEYLASELSTSGRQMARDLETQGAELRRTVDRARAAERLASIGTLVAGLAHEIGTPMGVIQGHAKLLEAKVSDEQARWRVRTIQEQVARISRIIQSLLNMARPVRRERGEVLLRPLLENSVAFLEEKCHRRQVRVVRELGDAPNVRGDAERLQQLFLNLLLNAIDAMPEGGELRVALGTSEDGEAQVRVADQGTGVADADLGRLFEPFFTTKPAGEGSGLGLAVAHGIVADHGGDIAVTSRVGEGTVFTVTLPAAPGRA